jgi:hypothetical protein
LAFPVVRAGNRIEPHDFLHKRPPRGHPSCTRAIHAPTAGASRG